MEAEIDFTQLPKDVQDVLSSFDENQDNRYHECARVITELESIGWTADYDLAGEIHSLKKL